MSEALSGLDMAWEQVVAVRTQNHTKYHPSAEAGAMSQLAQALYDERRYEEAYEVSGQVIELARRFPNRRDILQSHFAMWLRLGEGREEQADAESAPNRDPRSLLLEARMAYSEALRVNALGGEPEPSRAEEARKRVEALGQRLGIPPDRPAAMMSGPGPHAVETITVVAYTFPAVKAALAAASGFVAVKILGPFVEEWAKKIGEKLGESTVRSLGRLRARRADPHKIHAPAELEASLPGAHSPTTIILPQPLSDPAKLALIDLDPTDNAVCGQTLYWSETENAWLSRQNWFAAFKSRHPEFTVENNGLFVSWTDNSGPHTLSSESLTWMMAYLEAHFGC
jgi:hypothetical protein